MTASLSTTPMRYIQRSPHYAPGAYEAEGFRSFFNAVAQPAQDTGADLGTFTDGWNEAERICYAQGAVKASRAICPDNPYPPGHPAAIAWSEGYRAMRRGAIGVSDWKP